MNNLDWQANRLYTASKIVLVVGAGISTSLGVSDFRSTGGLFSRKFGQFRGRDLLNALIVAAHGAQGQSDQFLQQLRDETISKVQDEGPPSTHVWMKDLEENGKLLRCYTQNIDGLERAVDMNIVNLSDKLPVGSVVHLHGSVCKVRCDTCNHTEEWLRSVDGAEFRAARRRACPHCEARRDAKQKEGARSQGRVGQMRPDVLLYNENNPYEEEIRSLMQADCNAEPDMLLIMGTELKIHDLARFCTEAGRTIRSQGGGVIWVNRSQVSNTLVDRLGATFVQSTCEDWLQQMDERIERLQDYTPPIPQEALSHINRGIDVVWRNRALQRQAVHSLMSRSNVRWGDMDLSPEETPVPPKPVISISFPDIVQHGATIHGEDSEEIGTNHTATIHETSPDTVAPAGVTEDESSTETEESEETEDNDDSDDSTYAATESDLATSGSTVSEDSADIPDDTSDDDIMVPV